MTAAEGSTLCRSCGARIVWALTERGRRMPLDADPVAEPHEGVAFTIDEPPPGGGAPLAMHAREPGPPRYVSHFATCPQQGEWRRAR